MKKILILDSSQISAYYTCPVLWTFEYKNNLTVSNQIDEPIMAGTYGHELLDRYYKARCLGEPSARAANIALAFLPPADFMLSDELIKLIRARFNHYWMTYANNDFDPLFKETYAIGIDNNGLPVDDAVKTPLVEQGFSYPLLDTKEYLFILEGKIDLICNYHGGKAIVAHKFQFRKRDHYKKRIQFKNYCLATNINTLIVNYIRLHKELSKDTLVRMPCSFNPFEIQVWKGELIEIYKRIANEKIAHNWDSCEGKYGYPCKFTKICDEWPNSATANAVKAQYYQIKKEWKPW